MPVVLFHAAVRLCLVQGSILRTKRRPITPAVPGRPSDKVSARRPASGEKRDTLARPSLWPTIGPPIQSLAPAQDQKPSPGIIPSPLGAEEASLFLKLPL